MSPRRQHPRAHVAQRVIKRPGQRAVGAGLPVPSADPGRTHEHLLFQLREDDLGVLDGPASRLVDVKRPRSAAPSAAPRGTRRFRGPACRRSRSCPGCRSSTLRVSPGSRPSRIQRTASGSGDTGRSTRIRSNGWSRSQWSFRCWKYQRISPVSRLERQGRVVVEVRQIGAAEHEFRRGRRNGGAEVNEFELRVVAGNHPGADVVALLERHVAPGFVPGLAGPPASSVSARVPPRSARRVRS